MCTSDCGFKQIFRLQLASMVGTIKRPEPVAEYIHCAEVYLHYYIRLQDVVLKPGDKCYFIISFKTYEGYPEVSGLSR